MVYAVGMRDVTKIEVWHRARALTASIYKTTEALPTTERFGLQSQIRRASVSVVANIAEGCGRGTEGDLERHLRIASGSATELQTLLLLASDLGLMTDEPGVAAELIEIRKMLNAFTATVRRSRQGA